MIIYYYNPNTRQLEPSLQVPSSQALNALTCPKSTLFATAPLVAFLIGRFFKPGSLKKDDAENIRTIIKAGAESNVDEMEIELDREVTQGIDLKAFENAEGVNLTLGQKGKSRYRLKVKYKT